MNNNPLKKFQITKQLEFRPVFYLTPFLIAVFIISAMFLEPIWLAITGIILVLTILILIIISYRLSKINFADKLKNKQVQSIISQLSNGVVSYDNEFKVMVFNHASEEIFNIKAEDVVGTKLSADMASDPKFKTLIQTIFSSLAPVVVKRSEAGVFPQVVDISFDNPQLDVRIVTDKVLDENDNPQGFIKLITNKTREKELLKSKTEFITVAAHQLRTPLTAINWAFEALEKSEFPPDQKELVDTGFLAAKKMLKTVNDLLDISKMEEGKFGYQFEQENIVSFLEEILPQVNDIATQYNIKLYFQRPTETLLPVFIDRQKMSMVLFNLLDNAIKYNVENGTVTVYVENIPQKPYIKITIKDTGIGIPEEQVQKLFTKFFRADNAVKIVADGTGLGLYIVKNIVSRHGGDIWVESELNRGTSFFITLPTDQNMIPKKEVSESSD